FRNVESGREKLRLGCAAATKEASEVRGPFAFSHDGKTVAEVFYPGSQDLGHSNFFLNGAPRDASSFRPSIRLWETATAKERCRFETPLEPAYYAAYHPGFGGLGGGMSAIAAGVTSIQFSPDGRNLLVARGDQSPQASYEAARVTMLWDLDRRKEVRRFGPVDTFSPDGKYLAGITHDGKVAIWSVATGKLVAHAGLPTERVSAFAFSPDSKRIALGTRNAVIHLLEMEAVVSQEKEAPAAKDEDLQTAWRDLASASAEKAYKALHMLASHPAKS